MKLPAHKAMLAGHLPVIAQLEQPVPARLHHP